MSTAEDKELEQLADALKIKPETTQSALSQYKNYLQNREQAERLLEADLVILTLRRYEDASAISVEADDYGNLCFRTPSSEMAPLRDALLAVLESKITQLINMQKQELLAQLRELEGKPTLKGGRLPRRININDTRTISAEGH